MQVSNCSRKLPVSAFCVPALVLLPATHLTYHKSFRTVESESVAVQSVSPINALQVQLISHSRRPPVNLGADGVQQLPVSKRRRQRVGCYRS